MHGVGQKSNAETRRTAAAAAAAAARTNQLVFVCYKAAHLDCNLDSCSTESVLMILIRKIVLHTQRNIELNE